MNEAPRNTKRPARLRRCVPILAVLACFASLGVASLQAQQEIDVQRRLCAGMPINQHLSDGTEADCVREDVAIEVDFSEHWAAAIGQALHYGAVLERRPGIILVCHERTSERVCLNHKLRLEETVAYWNIGMLVWFCGRNDETLATCQFEDFFGPD